MGAANDRGAVPDDVEVLSLLAVGGSSALLVNPLQRHLQREESYHVLQSDEKEPKDDEAHAVLRIEHASERFTPTVFDAAGVATQYRLTIQARLHLMRKSQTLWKSGAVSVADDLFTTGTLAGIEASRKQLRQSLRQSWARKAISRLRSGF
ncbi:MAG: LPS assembly lipoprotein LptE [Mariprofundaceae bacterium]